VEKIKRLWDFRSYAGRGEYWAIMMMGNVVLFGGRTIGGAPELLITLLVVPVHAAVVARRLHDRGRSAWWTLLIIGGP